MAEEKQLKEESIKAINIIKEIMFEGITNKDIKESMRIAIKQKQQQQKKSINLIVSYRNSPMEHRLHECGGVCISIYKNELCRFLKDNKKAGFNEILYYKWMDKEKNWMTGRKNKSKKE